MVTYYAGRSAADGGAVAGSGTITVDGAGDGGKIDLSTSSVTKVDGIPLSIDLGGAWRCPG
ncbi:MAG TPA: hypothetical protein VI138_03525 [Candidatus Dormibacteraeota bacterium]